MAQRLEQERLKDLHFKINQINYEGKSVLLM